MPPRLCGHYRRRREGGTNEHLGAGAPSKAPFPLIRSLALAHWSPSNRRSRAARPRLRWVFTEFSEMERVVAISVMPASK